MSRPEYLHAQTPAPGTGLEISPGIFWLRLPLPIALDHINVWLLEDGDGWILVDTGIGVEATRAAWQRLDEDLLLDRPVRRVLVTHHHPDHFGLAGWHCDRFACPVLISRPAVDKVRYLLQEDISGVAGSVAEFYHSHGVDETAPFVEFDTGRRYRRVVTGIPDRIILLEDGQELSIGGRSWIAIRGDGHAEGHISLYCAELDMVISGDQVLPTISSNVSLYAHGAGTDPLKEYLDSLDRFSTLPASAAVLPSHGRVFRGLHERVTELRGEHRERLDQVLRLCREPLTAMEATALLFPRRLDDLNRLLAFGETLAHLRYLERRGLLSCGQRAGRNLFRRV